MSKNQFFAAAFSLAFVAGAARAEAEASNLSQASALPVASVAAAPEVTPTTAVVPTALAAAGAQFIVRDVESNAYATRYTLERASDGELVAVEIAGRGVLHSAIAGSVVVTTVVSTGVVLSVAGQDIAFVPNALGRALLHSERIAA